MEYTLIGYFSYKSKKTQKDMLCMFLGSEQKSTIGVNVQTIYCNPDVIEGSIKVGSKCEVFTNLKGYIVAVKFK